MLDINTNGRSRKTWLGFLNLLFFLGKGDLRLIRGELKAIRDFLLGRYGEYDKEKANNGWTH